MHPGTRVEGMYLGKFPFTGTITSRRWLTVPTDGCLEFFVKLDAPLELYNATRDTLVLHTRHDGSPSSYTKHSCRMRAVSA